MSFGEDTRFHLEADRLLKQALELPDAERPAFIETACAGRPELLDLVSRLADLSEDTAYERRHLGLGATEAGERLDAAEMVFRADLLDRRFGPYRILEELGRGGMGVVFLAERADGQFDRRVALKLLHYGAGRRSVDRFKQERRILAALDHPGISRLLDGGVTAEGLPYLVMEHVDGRPLDVYCAEENIDLQGRLELFLDVCRAVSAAHRRLVIHRDLKPSNILVTEDGTVKLLDFGIAKLLTPDADIDGQAEPTRAHAMTPSYASPEQFRGDPATVASDVYQLGLLLYRLLTGRLPYAVRPGRRADAERLICRVPAPRASTVTEDSDATSPDPLPLGWRRDLRGDLDNILTTALAKDPEARYASVAGLIDDLERHRSGLPVAARPPSFGYVAGKFILRHRVGTASVAGAVILFLALIYGYTARLTEERDRAEAARIAAEAAQEEAEVVSRSLVDLFSLTDPERGPDDPVNALELLRLSAERVRREMADLPVAKARFLHTLGEIHTKLERLDEAEPLLREALAEREAHLDADHPAVIESVNQLGVVLSLKRRDDEAEVLLQRALTARRQQDDGEAVALILNNLGNLEWRRGRLDIAEAWHREALEIRESLSPPDPLRIGDSANNLGVLINSRNRSEEALTYLRRAAEAYAEAYGPKHPSTAVAYNNLGIAEQDLGRSEVAGDYFRRAAEAWRSTYGPYHSRTLKAEHNVALNLFRSGRLKDARAAAQTVLDRLDRLDGSEHAVEIARNANLLGIVTAQIGDFATAETQLRRAYDLRRELYPEGHRRLLFVELNLLEMQRRRGDWERAESRLSRIRERYGSLLDGDPRFEGRTRYEHGLILTGLGLYGEAAEALHIALERRASFLPEGHYRIEEVRSALGALEAARGP